MFGEYLEFQNVHSPKTKIAKRMNLNDIGMQWILYGYGLGIAWHSCQI
jgi:hypothetical protein